jgi:hypothetical protein
MVTASWLPLAYQNYGCTLAAQPPHAVAPEMEQQLPYGQEVDW